MDIGIISVRYARALLKASTEAGVSTDVYQDMMALAKSYGQVPDLRVAVCNPMLSKDSKEKLLKTAVGKGICKQTADFLSIVLQHDRENMMQFIANSYVTLYRKQKNIIRGKLTTATDVTPALKQRMQKMVEAETSGTVEFETEINPEILGGFILEYDTFRMDNSVKSKLNNILSQLKAGSAI